MKKFIKSPVLLFPLLFVLALAGCKGKKKQEPVTETFTIDHKSGHEWYYFNLDGFAQVSSPWDSPFGGSVPYTEAVRISSANNAAGSLDTGNVKAYALVNRLGVLCFDGKDISMAKDISVFTDHTAENLVFMNDVPVFSVYKSAFFNSTLASSRDKNETGNNLFLIQFDDKTHISYPLVNCSNLGGEAASQVTELFWDGTTWFCSLKTTGQDNSKTDFSYLKFRPAVPLLSVSPVSAADQIIVSACDVQEFRNVMRVKSYGEAPARIKNMLAGFSTDLPFVLEVKSAGGSSPRIYENQVENSMQQELKAKAIISQSWSAALFEDGTLYIEGALPGKHILRGGKPVAIRLPKLREGYVYSDFVISGTMLYAAWEETDFYKIRRSGFLSVDLDSTLYSKLR